MSFINTLNSSKRWSVWFKLVVISSDPIVCLTLIMTRFVRSAVTEVGKPNFEANAGMSDTILVSNAVARECVRGKSKRELSIYSKQRSAWVLTDIHIRSQERTASQMLLHLRRHSDIWSTNSRPSELLLYQIVVFLYKPVANTKEFSLCVMLPKSSAKAITGKLSLIRRKLVSDTFSSLPTSVKLFRHTSE